MQKGFNSLSLQNRRKIYAMLDRPYSMNNTVRIDHPLILVSQIQRSGGSLFTRLFDHHDQIYTLPIELFCIKNKWLQVNEINNSNKFHLRHNSYMQRYLFKGFDKGTNQIDHRIFFDFNFGLQEEIIQQSEAKTERESLSRFFTSFFNSWTNYRNINGDKQFVLAFAPRTIQDIWKHNPEKSFFSAYPDGYIISIIREPKNWYSSAERHSSYYTSPDRAFKMYNSCLEASINTKNEKPDRTMLVRFKDLIANTEHVMRMICYKTGIDYSVNLLQPTFNSVPIKSNSSHKRVLNIDKNVMTRTPKTDLETINSYKKSVRLYKKAADLFDTLD